MPDEGKEFVMKKRVIPILLICSMLFPMGAMSAAAVNGTSNLTTLSFMAEGEEIIYNVSTNENITVVSYSVAGEAKTVVYDAETGIVRLNGEVISGFVTSGYVGEYNSIAPLALSDWTEYAREESSIMAEALSYADLVATIIALLSGAGITALLPGPESIITDMAQAIISEACPILYYTKISYYWDKGASRPERANRYLFYTEKEADGSYEVRWELDFRY